MNMSLTVAARPSIKPKDSEYVFVTQKTDLVERCSLASLDQVTLAAEDVIPPQ